MRAQDKLRIEEYIESLPQNIMSGNDVSAPPDAVRRMLELAGVKSDDVVYHLGCGDGSALRIALEEFGVDSVVGIEIDEKKANDARKSLSSVRGNHKIICADVQDTDISEANVVLFWFVDERIVERMTRKFESLRDGTRIITVWGAPLGCLPERVDFPFVRSVTPFRKARNVKEQLLAVLGVRCVDFVTAWEYAERYTRALGTEEAGKNRFLTIIQAVTIWINAHNLGVTCTDEMPESIKTYVGILRMFYNIEVEHLLNDKSVDDKAV